MLGASTPSGDRPPGDELPTERALVHRRGGRLHDRGEEEVRLSLPRPGPDAIDQLVLANEVRRSSGAWSGRGRGAGGHDDRGHRDRRAGPEHAVDGGDEVLDVDEASRRGGPRSTHSIPISTARSGSHPLANWVMAVALAAGAVADDQAGEPDLGMLHPPRLDELVEGRLADRVGAEARPRRRSATRSPTTGRRPAGGRGEVGERGAVKSDAPITLVSNVARHVSASSVLDRGERADGRRVDQRVDPAERVHGRLDRRRHEPGVGDVARDRERPVARLLAAVSSLSCRRASRATWPPRWASPMPMHRPSPSTPPPPRSASSSPPRHRSADRRRRREG